MGKWKSFAMMALLVAALGLAGCGGGGGTAAVEEEPPAEMPASAQEMCEADGGRYNADGSCTSAADLAEETALSGAQSAAASAASAAMAAVASAVDPVAASNAHTYAAMANTASEAAQAATTSADAMGHQMAAEDARDKAMEAAGESGLGITDLANKILNGDDIENAELAGTTPPKAVFNTENVSDAIEAATAAATADADLTIGAETVAGSLTNQGGLSDSTATQLVVGTIAGTVVADHGASGPTFAVGLGTTRFLEGETPSRFQIKGNEAQDLLLPDATPANMLKTHLVITTDIKADTEKPTPGAEIFDLTTLQGHITSDNNPVITGYPGDGSTFTGTYNQDPDDNLVPRTGVFACPDDTVCGIVTNDNGGVVAIAGYTFNAVSTETTKTADADYLAWGFWVQGSTRDSGPTDTNRDAQAGAFAYGSDRFEVRAELKGTASYEGSASGLYSAAGMVSYFDADVALEANFGGTTGADRDATTADTNDGELLGVVTGSVSNIKAGGMDVDGSLDLKRAMVTGPSGTADGDSDDGFTGTTEGTLGGVVLKGMWGGQFYGPNKAAANSTAAESEYPTGAAGTFSATGGGHSPVSLIGAFGAHRQ